MTNPKGMKTHIKTELLSLNMYPFSLRQLTAQNDKHKQTSFLIFFQINDGVFSHENNTLGRYCGQEIPLPVMSSTNVIRVQFKTDTLLALAGFNASYEHLKGIFMTVGQVKAFTSARHRLF